MKKEFTLTAPEDLHLPAFKIAGYDESQPLGKRCAWIIPWRVDDSDERQIKFRIIQPNAWHINDGAPDDEKKPDEYLLLELKDIAHWNGELGNTAARLYFGYDAKTVEGWRSQVYSFLQRAHPAASSEDSPYNPPKAKPPVVRILGTK